MRIEDRGSGIEEGKMSSKLDPRSSFPDPVLMQRMRWRCRRGLLELDIVLGRFVETHYAGLDEHGRRVFETLLDLPDSVLWGMIAGLRDAEQAEQQALLKKIRTV